jgi:hypothetical protein
MPDAQAGYAVKRIAGDLAELLDEQADGIADALALTDDSTLLRSLARLLQGNAEMTRIVTLLQAGKVKEAEVAVLALKARRKIK